ncbi:MAG: hypothetical protein BGP13_09790 [Sphingobacteriales bacterium 40-81]|nr:MAG: hypothetical protein BGP13_09790 [Sphingobacteriales bacterium 40-81]
MPYSQHESTFKQIQLSQQLGILEQHCTDLEQFITYENLTTEIWRTIKQGCIICTYHTGSYRAINRLLAKRKVPFVLAVSSSIYQTQRQTFLDLHNPVNNGQANRKSFEVIDAEVPGALIKMIRILKSRATLVLYIDGNTGCGSPNHTNENCCAIDFLGQSIYARTGIASLASLTGAAILPVVSYRKPITQIHLRFCNPLVLGKKSRGKDDNNDIIDTTHFLFRILESIVQLYPGQWESWLYLHKMINIVAPPTTRAPISPQGTEHRGRLQFNLDDFGIFKAGDDHFLFRKSGYSFYPIDDQIYGLLLLALSKPIVSGLFDKETARQLINNKVLVNLD